MQLEQGAGQSSLVPDKDVVKKSFTYICEFPEIHFHVGYERNHSFLYIFVPIALISLTFGCQATLRLSDFPGRLVQHLATLFSSHPWEITHHLHFGDKANQCPTAIWTIDDQCQDFRKGSFEEDVTVASQHCTFSICCASLWQVRQTQHCRIEFYCTRPGYQDN